MTVRFVLLDVDALGPLTELTQAFLSQLVASRPAGTTGILTSIPAHAIGSAFGRPTVYGGRVLLYPTRQEGHESRDGDCYRHLLATLATKHGFSPGECLVIVAPTAAVPGQLGIPSVPVTTPDELMAAIHALLQPSPEPAELALVAA